MGTHYIPRNVEGEGRILFIFSRKALVYTFIGAAVGGLLFYLPFSLASMGVVGIILLLLCALIGFSIATFKMPEITFWEFTKKTGGENIDEIIKRAIKFKRNKNKIYILKEGDTKDE